MLLEHLAGLVDQQVGRHVDYGLEHILHDLGGHLGRNGQLAVLDQVLKVSVVVVGNVGVVGAVE